MKILLSPTKKQVRCEPLRIKEPLLFPNKKEKILNILKNLSIDQIQKDFKISNKLTGSTYHHFQNIDESSPAIYTYTGEAFNTLDVKSFTEEELVQLNQHLLIFSALYGLLKPLNHITLYRLDLMNNFAFNLKDFWKEALTSYLNQFNEPIINLASNEFFSLIDESKIIKPIYHIHFLTKKDDKLKVVSAHAKKARGAFTRALIQQGFDDLTQIKIDEFDYSHKEGNHFYYIKTN